MNRKPMKSLMGSSPNEVTTNPELKFQVMEKQAENIRTNYEEDAKIKSRLQPGSGFRAPKPYPRALTTARSDVQRYEGKVRAVQSNEFGLVTDADGKPFPAKLVLPVNIDSEQLAEEADPRDPRRLAQARPILEKYVQPALVFIGKRTGFPQIGGFLNRQAGFPADAARANIKKAPVKGFLELFPEHFRIEAGPGGGYVYPRIEASVARRRMNVKQPAKV